MRRNLKGYSLGECHHRARYPDALVRAVVSAWDAGEGGYMALGKRFQVPWRTLADWCRRATRYVAVL